MNASTDTDDIVKRSLRTRAICEPLNDVSFAGKEVNGVVERAIESNFGDMCITNQGSQERKGFFGILSAVVPIILWAGVGSLVAIGAFVFLGSLLLIEVVSNDRENSPSTQFNIAARKLSSAIARVPNGPQKQVYQEFSREAARSFVLGHVATLQEQITQGDKTASTLKRMYKEGIRLIDRAALKLHWTASGSLKEAFKKGRLPEAKTFSTHLREEHEKLQKNLQGAIQQIQAAPA